MTTDSDSDGRFRFKKWGHWKFAIPADGFAANESERLDKQLVESGVLSADVLERLNASQRFNYAKLFDTLQRAEALAASVFKSERVPLSAQRAIQIMDDYTAGEHAKISPLLYHAAQLAHSVGWLLWVLEDGDIVMVANAATALGNDYCMLNYMVEYVPPKAAVAARQNRKQARIDALARAIKAGEVKPLPKLVAQWRGEPCTPKNREKARKDIQLALDPKRARIGTRNT